VYVNVASFEFAFGGRLAEGDGSAFDVVLMKIDNCFRDRQSQTRTARFARAIAIDAIKALKKMSIGLTSSPQRNFLPFSVTVVNDDVKQKGDRNCRPQDRPVQIPSPSFRVPSPNLATRLVFRTQHETFTSLCPISVVIRPC
jgi:hypothetical protein